MNPRTLAIALVASLLSLPTAFAEPYKSPAGVTDEHYVTHAGDVWRESNGRPGLQTVRAYWGLCECDKDPDTLVASTTKAQNDAAQAVTTTSQSAAQLTPATSICGPGATVSICTGRDDAHEVEGRQATFFIAWDLQECQVGGETGKPTCGLPLPKTDGTTAGTPTKKTTVHHGWASVRVGAQNVTTKDL